jgi:pimeloyl-ACP methyl ester carboxylesterase
MRVQLNFHREGTGEPLVLLHGIGSRWEIWKPVLGLLTPQRDVLAVDLPGFAGSPMPPGPPPAGTDSLTRLISAWLDTLGLERPHVAGNSLGGLISLELAKRGRVRSATALSPAGFFNRPDAARARAALWLGVRAARRASPRAEAMMRPRVRRRVALGALVAHPTRIPADDAAASLRALAAAPWFDATLRAIASERFVGGERITVPVTIAWGANDHLLPPRQARRAATAIPHARLIELTGCGHVPTYDDPKQVAGVLLTGSAEPAGGEIR